MKTATLLGEWPNSNSPLLPLATAERWLDRRAIQVRGVSDYIDRDTVHAQLLIILQRGDNPREIAADLTKDTGTDWVVAQ